MDNDEFLYHMEIISDMLKYPHVRIILHHPPYNEDQQVIIDTICRNSVKIVGQIIRKPPIIKAAKEIERLILSHHEPNMKPKNLQFVIIGQQKIKKK